MIYRKFDQTTQVSRLGMGAMRLPVKAGEPNQPIDTQKAQAIIDYAIAHGITYFDTAYIYHNGESERFLGEALSRYPRDSYLLADKYNLQANPDYQAEFAEQLSRLQTDHIDFYLLHGVQDQSAATFLSNGCIEYFQEQKKAGRIQYFGFSFHGSPEVLKRIVAAQPWDFVQIQLNYYDWYYGEARALYEILTEHNIPVMVMEPVHGGRLASLTPEANALLTEARPDQSIASWAMRWAMSLPDVYVVLSGMSNLRQIADNVATFAKNEPLTAAENVLLMKACELYRPSVSVACTGCRYCCDDCPQSLDIPKLLAVYNEVKLDGPWRLSFLEHLPEDQQPSACINCGSCQALCPQNINIPAHLEEMAGLAEQMKR